jgi:pimeloyl-ACP methyl ester carboxylesterase
LVDSSRDEFSVFHVHARFLLPLTIALLALGGCTQYSKVHRTDRPGDLAVTARQRDLAAELRRQDDPLARIGAYLQEADEARRDLARNPGDVRRRSDYNFAVARIMDIISREKLAPWDRPLACPGPDGRVWRLRLTPPYRQAEYHPSNFEFTPSDRYNFRGKLVGERVLKQGLGAPLVVESTDLDYIKLDRFAQGNRLFYGFTALAKLKGTDAEIVLLDPLSRETVTMDGRTHQLAGDFQGPLALALAELHPRRRELAAFFSPQKFEDRARLARLQPYDPRKIPVLFIHGLTNSPATWAPVVEFLRGDPNIRKNYQFWYFSYPTGLPYPLTAAMLRQQLAEIRKKYPGHKDIVVIGHSMGGMISRMLVTDSGTKLWDTFFDSPPDELPFSEETRRMMAGSLIFQRVPHIGRVIFVSASHRGSYMATDFFGRLGAAIVGQPIAEEQVYLQAATHLRPELRTGRKRLPNSVDLLDPDNPFLRTLDTLPVSPRVPFHSLIGDRGRGGYLDRSKPQSSDGIVPYWSSHMPGAQSERVIPSGHWSHLHPLGMVEINRILVDHLRN